MTDTRRLSAEWRQNRQAELDEEREGGALIALELELDDALHDLDVAEREIETLNIAALEGNGEIEGLEKELIALKREIGMAPEGASPEEQKPRGSTWHAERRNWEAEVRGLRINNALKDGMIERLANKSGLTAYQEKLVWFCAELAAAQATVARLEAELVGERKVAKMAKQIRADERRKFGEQAARVIMDAARGPEDDEVLQRAQDEIRALNQPAAQPEEAADG